MREKRKKMDKKKVRTYSANDGENDMLDSIAKYHGVSKSGWLTSMIRKEFWRVFPDGTKKIKPDRGATKKG